MEDVGQTKKVRTEKVRLLAEKIYNECKASNLTLGEFHILAQLLLCKHSEIRKKAEEKISGEILQ